jgi:hypothetical protein
MDNDAADERYSLALIVRDPELDPQTITARLNVEPTDSCTPGETAYLLFKQKRWGTWEVRIGSDDIDSGGDLLQLARGLRQEFPEHLDNLHEIASEYETYIALAVYYDAKYAYCAFEMKKDVIRILSEFGLKVFVSVYPCDRAASCSTQGPEST